jgi:hypothetical protein
MNNCYFCEYENDLMKVNIKDILENFGFSGKVSFNYLGDHKLVCPDCYTIRIKKKRAKRGTKKRYFTKIHEEAIVRYNKSDDYDERNNIYNTFLKSTFEELVEKVVYTYKFNSLPNIDSLKDECLVWIPTVMIKYDNSRGTAAFSYFTVITKNWFIHQVKRNTKKAKREVEINESLDVPQLVTNNEYLQKREKHEFWREFLREVSTWDTRQDLKENEVKVLQAIKILFDSSEEIEIFNKKAIYLYMNEITGLPTKQIVLSLKKFKKRYSLFRKKWDNGRI